MKISKKAPDANGIGTSASTPGATVAERVANLRRASVMAYREAARIVFEAGDKPKSDDLDALAEAAEALGLDPGDADQDVKALKAHAAAKACLAEANARCADLGRQGREAREKLDEFENKERARLLGVIANVEAQIRMPGAWMRSVAEIEAQCPRMFGDPTASATDMERRRERAVAQQGYASSAPR